MGGSLTSVEAQQALAARLAKAEEQDVAVAALAGVTS